MLIRCFFPSAFTLLTTSTIEICTKQSNVARKDIQMRIDEDIFYSEGLHSSEFNVSFCIILLILNYKMLLKVLYSKIFVVKVPLVHWFD